MTNKPNLPLSPAEARLLVKVSWLYYQEGMTQQQIGERLGFSRVKINRLIQQAHGAGIVTIQIHEPPNSYSEIEHDLSQRFQLTDVVVVPEAEEGEPLYQALAKGVIDWLMPRLRNNILIGLSIGRTVSHLPSVFRPEQPVDCMFLEIMGGAADHTRSLYSFNVTSQMAELAGGKAQYLYAPTVLSSPEVRSTLLNEPSVAEALKRASNCDITIQSVGSIADGALLYQSGYLDDADMEALRAAGAVGDVLCHHINQLGEPVPSPLTDRLMTISLEALRQTPWSVCVAGGDNKVAAIAGALIGRLFNVLVTDVTTARSLLSFEAVPTDSNTHTS